MKISRLALLSVWGGPRRLSVTAYAEWVLGTSRGSSGPFIVTEIDGTTGAMLARNPWSVVFSGRVAFVDLGGRQRSEEHTSELQSLMRNSSAVLCLKKKTHDTNAQV